MGGENVALRRSGGSPARPSRGADGAGDRRAGCSPGRGGGRLHIAEAGTAEQLRGTYRLGGKTRCANFKVPRYMALVDTFENIGDDGQQQGAEEQAARVRSQASGILNVTRWPRMSDGDSANAVSSLERSSGAASRWNRTAGLRRWNRTAGRLCCVKCFARDGLQREAALPAHGHQGGAGAALRGYRLSRGWKPLRTAIPKVVPQFADATDMLRGLPRRPVSTTRPPAPMCARSSAPARRCRRRLRRQRDQPAGLGHGIALDEEPGPQPRRSVGQHPADGHGGRWPLPADRHDFQGLRLVPSKEMSIPAP